MHFMHLVESPKKLIMIRIISLSLVRIMGISYTQSNLKLIEEKNLFKSMPAVGVTQRAKVKLKMSLVLLRIALRNTVFILHWMTGMNKGSCGLKERAMARFIIQQRKNRSMFSK